MLGQSFGGFCVLTYLSLAPEGLREAFFTGGLPPIGRPVDDVYRATYERVLERNRRYYERYPEDRERVRELAARLDADDVRLPTGDRLTARRFRQLGNMLGMSDGAEQLHYLLELPPDSPAFLHDVEAAGQLRAQPALRDRCTRPATPTACATRWSAERMLPDDVRRRRSCFTGEHVYPWMFEDYGALAPLREAAELLAAARVAAALRRRAAAPRTRSRPPRRSTPRTCTSSASSRRRRPRRSAALRAWVTNEYEHNGLRADGDRVLGRLIDLARGRA